jgi:ABC-type multidrug transport system ATPase subunit
MADSMDAKYPVLAFRDIERSLGRSRILSGITFDLYEGEFLAVFGLPGAGKTALLRLAAGLTRPGRGTVAFRGHGVPESGRGNRREIAIVLGPSLVAWRSVRSNLRFQAAVLGLAPKAATERIGLLLERFDLVERAGDKVRSIGDVNRQRLELVRALLGGPRLLLVNGVADDLPAPERAAIVAANRQVCAEERTSVLWATARTDISAHVSRLVVLSHGRMAFDGPPSDIQDQLSRDGSAAFTAPIGSDAATDQ